MGSSEIIGKVTEYLQFCSGQLSKWLGDVLPQIKEDWWDSLVFDKLTDHQKVRVDKKRINSLRQLDLAALIRIIDQNWFLLKDISNWRFEERNYVMEMRAVRNRWAHVDAAGIDSDIVYRDLDTIQRFLQLLDCPQEKVKALIDLKQQIHHYEESQPNSKINQQTDTNVSNGESIIHESQIALKSLVSLKSNPEICGPVLTIEGSGPSAVYHVFVNGSVSQYYFDQLEPVEQSTEIKIVSMSKLHCILTSLQINHPSISTLYSLNAARIDFVPYQFRPALKIIRSDRPRLLIADGVGVGKTIEAGLILRELQARSEIESILIICPRPLVTERKWQLEMKRFDELFTHLDGRALRICIDEMDLEGEWPDLHRKTILPFSLFDEKLLHGNETQQIGLLDLDPPPHFNLVIVDEAHHIRNPSTFTHQGVRLFCDNAEAVVFLTATPIQLGNQDLFSLLNVLRPDLIIDRDTFQHMAEPNRYINAALMQARGGGEDWQQRVWDELNNASGTAWGSTILRGNPRFQETCRTLQAEELNRESRISIIREIEQYHSFARIINRTRRKDIGDFCIRRTETNTIPFTVDQKLLHDELLNFEAQALALLHGHQSVRFMMSMIRRQAASCIFGLAPFISDLLNRRLSELQLLEPGDIELGMEADLTQLNRAAMGIEEFASNLSSEDPKLEVLLQIISDKLKLENNKLIIFSSFIHTLAYLEKRLISAKVRVGVVHGGIDETQRIRLRNRFEMTKECSDAIDVMLFSEIGCEGLDYQFCDAMINYDLPWNPMRIEQRIGRIDRRGQKSAYVTIYNFITPDTVDADIYFRCLMRIGIFEESIGDCDEILGDIHTEIRRIAENIELTEDERSIKLEQLADNELSKIQEQRQLEDSEHELFGLQVPKAQFDQEVQSSDSYWLTSFALERLIRNYLNDTVGYGEYISGDSPLKRLRLSQSGRATLLNDLHQVKDRKSQNYKTWERWLKGADRSCSITFDSECAANNRDALFIMPLHPLVLQAASYYGQGEQLYTSLKVIDNDLDEGEYAFAIYSWEYKGIRSEIKLIPICGNAGIHKNFFEYLESGVDMKFEKAIYANIDKSALEKLQYELWQEERIKHSNNTKEICLYRLESLETSVRSRLNVVEDQIRSATNEKILKMRTAQKDNINTAYQRDIEEIRQAERTVDIHTKPLIYGIITIVKG